MGAVPGASLIQLLGLVLGYLKAGKIPPTPVLTALVSKVSAPSHLRMAHHACCTHQRRTQCACLLQGLGLGIVAGSAVVKLPQVLNVVRAGSADGLNPLSFELETMGLCIAATYGFLLQLPFSAFGEVVVRWQATNRRSHLTPLHCESPPAVE